MTEETKRIPEITRETIAAHRVSPLGKLNDDVYDKLMRPIQYAMKMAGEPEVDDEALAENALTEVLIMVSDYLKRVGQ